MNLVPLSTLDLALAALLVLALGALSLQLRLDLARPLLVAALRTVDLEDLAARDVTTLSGGEYQRLQIATLLTQNPTLSLLDEPINHLDLHHQISILKTLTAELAARAQAVIMVLHDINLAARFCDHLLLLFGSGQSCQDAPATVLNGENLQKLYGHPLQRLEVNGRNVFLPE